MNRTRVLSLLLACALLLTAGCGQTSPPAADQAPSGSSDVPAADPAVSQPPATDTSPSTGTAGQASAADELRGVWVSFLDLETMLTDTTPTTAAAALDTMLDTCVARGLNTVYFHVRSHSDAWYASTRFPAAAVAGPLLEQDFDPLAYAIEAAHARGIKLHAWINPYRVGEDAANAVVTGTENLFQKNNIWYYNPASDTVRQAILAGVREILQGYAVDGIHFDDYFYPTGMAADGESFENIPAGADVAAWRRTQVNVLVSAVYGLVHTKSDCVFGISPAANLENCLNKLYADVAAWMATPGYVDYICPQLYFGFQHSSMPYETVLAQWLALPRREDVRLYVGLALYKAGLASDTYAGDGQTEWSENSDILARQVTLSRQAAGADGFVLFRYQHLLGGTDAQAQELAALAACL